MQKPRKQERFDDSFYRLAGEVTRAIEKNKNGADQKAQVEELINAERKFKDFILRYRFSTQVYKMFLQHVCIVNRNILSARPFFRESAITFSKSITPAIKANDIETLKTFNINYQFIKFIRTHWHGVFPPRGQILFDRVHRARTILVENNMPLAINRAKLFYRKTPRSHLTLMDLIEICAMGLAAGIDKYVGDYTPVFRSVCIGRMVGNMIDAYSETMLHFYPSDRRILYKANSIRGRQGIEDVNELAAEVNASFQRDKLEGKSIPEGTVIASELSSLMNGASTVSADATMDNEGFGVYDFTPDTRINAEEAYIEHQETMNMLSHAKKLPILNKKVLRLKGLKL